MEPARISVCVVGAGPVGLCAARQLAVDAASFSFDVYERGEQLGGTWLYTPKAGVDEHGLLVHSSMYEHLRANFVQEVMGFPDFPFPGAVGNSYPSRHVVLKYLQDYANHFDLLKYIQFSTPVRAINPIPKDDGYLWSVTSFNLQTKTEITKTYDSVMVCSGINTTPDTPSINGIEAFNGHVVHCHDYKTPDPYKGLSVAVLGGSFSGKDISMDISPVAKQVYLCHSLPPHTYKMPSNLHQVPSIKEAAKHGFTLDDGSFIKVDALIYCTGYKFDFPFLSSECGIFVRGKRVKHLYKHLVNIEKPTMALVGLPFNTIPLPVSLYQVAYFLKTLKEPSYLPSKREMYEYEEDDFQKKIEAGYPPRHAHKMDVQQWSYMNDLADIAGIPRLAPVYEEFYKICMARMAEDFATYRSDNFTEVFKTKMKQKENQVQYNFDKK